jgi:hypothetical protein
MNKKVKNTKSTFAPHQFGKRDDLSEVMKRCKNERKREHFFQEVVGAYNQGRRNRGGQPPKFSKVPFFR